MGGRTWRLMHQGHSRGCAFLQFFLCLWGVSPAVSASVSQFGQHGAIVARGKPPLRPFGACFGRVGRLVLAASLHKGWARTMGRVLEQLSARQVLLTRSMCAEGLGAQGTMQRAPNYMPQAFMPRALQITYWLSRGTDLSVPQADSRAVSHEIQQYLLRYRALRTTGDSRQLVVKPIQTKSAEQKTVRSELVCLKTAENLCLVGLLCSQ